MPQLTGSQSKEGLFDIMFDQLKDNGISGRSSNDLSIQIIDDILTPEIRRDKAVLKNVLIQLSSALLNTSKLI